MNTQLDRLNAVLALIAAVRNSDDPEALLARMRAALPERSADADPAPDWAHAALDDLAQPDEMGLRGAPDWAHDLLDAIWDLGSIVLFFL